MTALTSEQMLAMISKLQAENAALKAQPARKLTFKVTAQKADGTGTNGAVSVYGLGRFPVTLYAQGWEQLIKAVPDLQAFIKANEAIIARK
jgi:hypothetical protein